MITKFKCSNVKNNFVEFERDGKNVFIEITDTDLEVIARTILDENQLFSLIGQLLRMQSEIRKEVYND